jgi:hypothetical protein
MCLVVMMGEHGEVSLQSNLESFKNLDKLMNELEKRKSFMMNDTYNKKPTRTNFKEPSNIYTNNDSFPGWNDVSIMNPHSSSGDKDQDKFEQALKNELSSRKNPLRQLEIYISRVKRLCRQLDRVNK